MTSPRSPWSRRGRLIAVTAVVVVAATALAGLALRHRGRTAHRPSDTTYSVPLPAASPQPAAGSPRPAPGGRVTCPPGDGGPLRRDTQFTDVAGNVVHYSISLPADYYTACKRYPVIYALHGKTQDNVVFMDEALSMRRAMAAGVLDQAVIVTPDGYSTGRWENLATGPAEDDVIRRLIPFVERTYRVVPGGSYRLLVGFSMGGHGALRFGLKYPTMFAAVWSVDGAMGATEDYLPFVQGRSSGDFRIIAAGGRLNGDRVRALVDGLGRRGIVIPYIYQDLDHEFVAFVDADGKGGWQAMRYLQQNLGRVMP